MDEKSVRAQLDDVSRELDTLDERREVLLSLVRGFEGWLRLDGSRATTFPLPEPPSKPRESLTAQKGSVSVRSAVLQVIKDARGEPLHAREIARRMIALGAVTAAKDPPAIVDLVAGSLSKRDGLPIEKVAGRTWRWKVEN